jgi:hypothetical protein
MRGTRRRSARAPCLLAHSLPYIPGIRADSKADSHEALQIENRRKLGYQVFMLRSNERRIMQLRVLAICLAAASASFASTNLGFAADAPILNKTAAVRVSTHCRHDRCHSPCPGRYSCSPLYGAYGPWGGEQYWAAYSYAWGY